jgi:hypothetical protein
MPEQFKIPLTPKQHRMLFDLAEVDEVLYGGQAGPGKSRGLLAFALHRRLSCPGSVGLALRRTFKELDKSLIRVSLTTWGPFGKWIESKGRWEFPNGSIQEFGYCEADRDVYQYQSAEYDDIAFDELTHLTNFQYLYLLSRLRPHGNWKTLARAASNPGNIGHKWVRERFVACCRDKVIELKDDDGTVKTRSFIPATLADNTLMTLKEKADYRAWLANLPDVERQQLRDGVWDDADIKGAYYAELIHRARAENRIGRVPYAPQIPVETFWDLGMDDSMAIWFAQRVVREIRVVDYYENSGEGLVHYAKVLKDKPYAYGAVHFPHDGEVRELGTGKSRKEVAISLGLKPVLIGKKLDPADRIEAVRNILPQCYFDEAACEKGIDALEHYRKEWDERNQVFKAKPVHDWSSHAADGFGELALGFADSVPLPARSVTDVLNAMPRFGGALG